MRRRGISLAVAVAALALPVAAHAAAHAAFPHERAHAGGGHAQREALDRVVALEQLPGCWRSDSLDRGFRDVHSLPPGVYEARGPRCRRHVDSVVRRSA